MTIRELQESVHANSRAHGFWPEIDDVKCARSVIDSIPERLALIYSEISEALEEYRNPARFPTTTYYEGSKPTGLPSELADAVIRIFDLAGGLRVDLAQVIEEKAAYNRARPYRHGWKRA